MPFTFKTSVEHVLAMASANRRFRDELLDHPELVDRLVVQGLRLSSTEQRILKRLTHEQIALYITALHKHCTPEDIRQLSETAESVLNGQFVDTLKTSTAKPEQYTQTRGLSSKR